MIARAVINWFVLGMISGWFVNSEIELCISNYQPDGHMETMHLTDYSPNMGGIPESWEKHDNIFQFMQSGHSMTESNGNFDPEPCTYNPCLNGCK